MIPHTGDNAGRSIKACRGRLCRAARRRAGLRSMLMIAALAATGDAGAMWGDRIEFFVGQARTWDNNVFRISGSSDPVALLGTPAKDDVYDTTSIGLNFDVPVSRQRFQGGIDWQRKRYDRFKVLDFTDRHGRALWHWQAGDGLSGELGYIQSRELASLDNVQSGVQSSVPNALDSQRTYFNAAGWLTPRWKMRAEVSRTEQSNALPAFQVNDIDLDGIDIAASYVSAAGSSAGLGLKFMNGDLPVAQPVAGMQVDNSYRQQGADLLGEWIATAKSRVSARFGWVNRNYRQMPDRNYSGSAFDLRYEWQATAKFAVTAIALRDISTTEQINVGFVLVDGIGLRPRIRVTEKIDIAAALEYSEREYLGDPGLVLGTVAARTDRVRTTAVTATWQPRRPITLGIDWRRETRASSAIAGDYAVDVVTVRLRVAL